MTRLRNIATAFISSGDDYLLMQRSPDAKIAPGFWYGIGGHLLAEEFSEPAVACLREIEEESGLKPQDLSRFRLRMLVMRQSGQELVLNYIFTAETKKRSVVESAEGSLYWVARDQVADLKLVDVIRLIFLKVRELDSAERNNSDSDNPVKPDCSMDYGLKSELEQTGLLIGMMQNQQNPHIFWQQLTDWPGLI